MPTAARLTIAHVLSPVVPVTGKGYVLPETYEQIVRAAGLLVTGTPHEQLVRALKSLRADLAVIGTHGRTGLARCFLGSVAARVITLAPCPVLTVRGR